MTVPPSSQGPLAIESDVLTTVLRGSALIRPLFQEHFDLGTVVNALGMTVFPF